MNGLIKIAIRDWRFRDRHAASVSLLSMQLRFVLQPKGGVARPKIIHISPPLISLADKTFFITLRPKIFLASKYSQCTQPVQIPLLGATLAHFLCVIYPAGRQRERLTHLVSKKEVAPCREQPA